MVQISKSALKEMGWVAGIVASFWLLAWLLSPFLGYHAVGILFLMAVVLSGVLLSRFSVFSIACLLSLVHNYFFIPPLHTFRIREPQDLLVYVMLFVAAASIGLLTSRLKRQIAAALERELLHESRKRIEVLEQAERLFRTLLDSVSHELKTPLTTIKGATSALLTQPDDAELVSDLASQIGGETERLLTVVNNMLDMTRLETGSLKPKIEIYDIADVLGPSLKRIGSIKKKREFETRIAPDLKPLKCDGPLVVQALANILHNSVVHTMDKGTIEVQVSNRQDGMIEIQISDNGPGLPKDNPNIVFDKFYRNRPESNDGVGLGLSIARGFIEAQGGSLVATNRKNGGAAFTMVLPAG